MGPDDSFPQRPSKARQRSRALGAGDETFFLAERRRSLKRFRLAHRDSGPFRSTKEAEDLLPAGWVGRLETARNDVDLSPGGVLLFSFPMGVNDGRTALILGDDQPRDRALYPAQLPKLIKGFPNRDDARASARG